MYTNLCFFDDFFIDCRRNVSRIWHTPSLAGTYQDPVFDLLLYPSIEWCQEEQKYKLWYEVIPDFSENGVRYLCLAQSEDGVHFQPSSYTNKDTANAKYRHCVYSVNETGLSGSSVYYDPNEKNPELRYKYTGMLNAKAIYQSPRGKYPVTISASPDGVTWTPLENNRVYEFNSDTYNRLFFNPVTGKYSVIMRAGFVDRRICLVESSDLKTFTDPSLILHPDAESEDGLFSIQHYGMGVRWNGGIFLGFLMQFHTSLTDEDLIKMNGYMDAELVYSYDGRYWMHTTRKPLVQKSASPDFGFNQLYILDMAENGKTKENLLVAVATRNPHLTGTTYDEIRKKIGGKLGQLNFYSIRKDGYCGLECCGVGGKIITKPFLLDSSNLTLNISSKTGLAYMSVLDYTGEPYDGFSKDNCIPISEDDIAYKPHWHDHDLQELVGKRVRFCIELNSAALYSIAGSFRPYIACVQTSISDPKAIDINLTEDKQVHPYTIRK